MDDNIEQLYELLVDYRERRHYIETPDEVKSALEEVLNALSTEDIADEEELEIIADFIENNDMIASDAEEILDTIREYERKHKVS